MKVLKLGYAAIVFTLLFTIFTSCSEDKKQTFYFTLDVLGLLRVKEPMIDIPLGKQETGKVFSFADYCEEEYDSIFLVYSYFNIEREDFLNLKMSNRLRRKCDNNTNFDSFNTLLFVRDGTVKAYSRIECIDADFDCREVEEHYVFPFKQKFALDTERLIRLYGE